MKPSDVEGPVVFLDVEASGLHAASYPIEIGWADRDLRVESVLIRPLPAWGVEDWSAVSEGIHNIRREVLLGEGVEAADVALKLNEALTGRLVLSDAPSFDGHWLAVLFRDTGVEPRFGLSNYTEYFHLLALARAFHGDEREMDILDDVEAAYPHVHRAGPDALGMAARWKAVSDRDWRAQIPRRK